MISFTTRYVQEAVRAYFKQAGKEIKSDPFQLSENFYEKQMEYEIRFNTNAVWKFYVAARRPVGQMGINSNPSLRIVFTDSHGNASGTMWLRTRPAENKYSMTYQATVPTPDPKTIAGDRDLSDFEGTIREVFQRVVEAQLIQALE